MRKAGLTYEAISDAIGVSKQQVHRIVRAALVELAEETREEAETLRQLELERIESLFSQAYSQATQGNLAAIDRCVKLCERRCKILGLDAPSRSEVTASLTSTNEWVELRTRILAVLERYPEARNELIRELQGEPT